MQESLQARFQAHKKWICIGAAAAVLLIMLIILTVMNVHLSAAESRSDTVLLALAQKMQSELVFALRTYDGIYKSDADFDGTILPAVRRHLNTAVALNDILVAGYGSRFAVIAQDMYNRLEHFYSEYALAQKAGRSTADAMGILDGCMHDLETIVLTRFEANGALILEPGH